MKKWILPILIGSLIAGCGKVEKPRLVVLISIDHLSEKAFTHYSDLYTGGLKWILDHGFRFDRTFHDHGYTATGPGHFVIGSGRYPGPAGVLGNTWFDRETKSSFYCVEDPLAKPLEAPSDLRSYRLTDATAIGDWMKAANPRSKVYSVAGKDRAAVYMGGKHPDLAAWYNYNGAYTTTDYYVEAFPDWLSEFNRNLNVAAYRDSLWERSLPEETYLKYARRDDYPGEMDTYNSMIYSPVFPLGFDTTYTPEMVLLNFAGTPWEERATLKLAETILTEEKLGQDAAPDLLCIGFSATDWITHAYGPFSQEAMDDLIKLDRYLGKFLAVLDREVGLANTLIVLTSDHGGVELPEFLKEKTGVDAGRIDPKEHDHAFKRATAEIDSIYGTHDFVHSHGLGIYLDPELMAEHNVNRRKVMEIYRKELETVRGFAKVLFREDILAATPADSILFRLKNFMHPQKSPDLWILQAENWVFRNPYGTSHGTPYNYDAQVPLLFCSPWLKPTVNHDRIVTVDIAPTIADILGITPDPRIDGTSLKPKMKPYN